jgi:glycosyltransferase involved in cell wall biosynthesis
MTETGISIIIIAFNEEGYLPGLLESLLVQSTKTFEIIIVDSNSTDNTYPVAMSFQNKFDQFRYLKLDMAKGPAFARNRGAEIASYERLLFLDADTRLRNDFIHTILSQLNRKKLQVATCPIRISEQDMLSNSGAIFLNMFMILLRPVYSCAYGACLISTGTVHRQLNGFNENLGVCEDCNYVKRARRIYNYRFSILTPYFYTSDRRAKAEGPAFFLLKYLKIHIYRMFTGREILKGEIEYYYGKF